MDELLKLAPSTEIQSPSAVLQLADSLLERGFVGDAARLLDSHSDFVDMRILNADQYALLVGCHENFSWDMSINLFIMVSVCLINE